MSLVETLRPPPPPLAVAAAQLLPTLLPPFTSCADDAMQLPQVGRVLVSAEVGWGRRGTGEKDAAGTEKAEKDRRPGAGAGDDTAAAATSEGLVGCVAAGEGAAAAAAAAVAAAVAAAAAAAAAMDAAAGSGGIAVPLASILNGVLTCTYKPASWKGIAGFGN